MVKREKWNICVVNREGEVVEQVFDANEVELRTNGDYKPKGKTMVFNTPREMCCTISTVLEIVSFNTKTREIVLRATDIYDEELD